MVEHETNQSMKAAMWSVEHKFYLYSIKVKFAKVLVKMKNLWGKNTEKKIYANYLMQNSLLILESYFNPSLNSLVSESAGDS